MKAAARLAFAALIALFAALIFGHFVHAAEGKIGVVAAENFYGDIAKQIGGDRVEVVSIMNNPDQDPHLFETTPGVVRQIADAQIVIVNGADYDPWMDKLLAAAPRPGRTVISAAAAHRQEARRQSASLVRSGDHAGGGESHRRGASPRPTPRMPPIIPRG